MIFNNLEALNQLKAQLPEGEQNAETEPVADKKKAAFSPQSNLRIWLERQKGNRVATLVKGFEGATAELDSLAKALKSHCGVGGTAKNGEIILQGDHREKVFVFFARARVSSKKSRRLGC